MKSNDFIGNKPDWAKKKSYKQIREEILSGKGVIKLSNKENIAILKDLNRPQETKPKIKDYDKPKRTKTR